MAAENSLLPEKLDFIASVKLSSGNNKTKEKYEITLVAAAGSVLDYEGDCFVNAANHNGGITGFGLDEQVNRAGGGPALKEARRHFQGITTGAAKSTPSFGLLERKVRWIIHAVGPVFHHNAQSKESLSEKYGLLKSAYSSSLKEASKLGLEDIAFCLLSCGMFRGEEPLEKVIQAGIDGILEFFKGVGSGHENTPKQQEHRLRKVVIIAYTLEEQEALKTTFGLLQG